MFLCQATTNFVHCDLGARRRGEQFWATEAQADHLQQIDAARVIEGKVIAHTYDTKAEQSYALLADRVSAQLTSLSADPPAGPSGPQTTATSSEPMAFTPATDSGGKPKRKYTRKAGPKTS